MTTIIIPKELAKNKEIIAKIKLARTFKPTAAEKKILLKPERIMRKEITLHLHNSSANWELKVKNNGDELEIIAFFTRLSLEIE